MVSRMFAVTQELKVVRIVVEGIAIYVVNVLRAKERAADHLAHDVPVFPDPPRATPGRPISRR